MKTLIAGGALAGMLGRFLFTLLAPMPRRSSVFVIQDVDSRQPNGSEPYRRHQPAACLDCMSTLMNGQMLLPGIAESRPWRFNPRAETCPEG